MAGVNEEGAQACEEIPNKTDIWERISKTWVIYKLDTHLHRANGNKMTSPPFYSEKSDYAWEMYFYPAGKDYGSQGCLGAYLHSISRPKTFAQTEFTLSIRDSGDCVLGADTQKFSFTTQETVRGFPELVKRSDLPSLIKDNIVKIHVDLIVKIHSLEIEKYIVCLGQNYPETRLQKAMGDLFESASFSDAVFVVGDTELKVHKSVLSSRSPVFEAMFTHDSLEKHSGIVEISDFEHDSFKRFLRFVYDGKVEFPTVEIATDLFRAAEKYDFPDLKLLCVEFISANLNSLNVAPVLLFAETFGAKDLKQITMKYILQNIEFFSNVEMQTYKLIENENPKLFPELLVMASQKFVLQNREP